MVDSQNLFYFQDSLVCRGVNTVWVCTVALTSCRPWKRLLRSHAWPCLEQKRQPPNRREFSVKSLLLTDLPAFKSAEVSANSGEKEENYRIVPYGWATVHKQFRTYDKIEILRKKVAETLFSSLQDSTNDLHQAQNNVWSRQNSPGVNRFNIWLWTVSKALQ